jgi:Predicted integral membrane protein (DUF2269)
VTVFTALVTLHVCLVVIGFGPLFVYPLMVRSAATASATSDDTSGSTADTTFDATPDATARHVMVLAMVRARRRVSEPAFLAVGPVGILAATQHPDEDVFHRLWVQAAIPLWMIAVSVVWFVQRPLSTRVVAAAKAAVDAPGHDTSERFRRLASWLTRVTWISWVGLVGMVVLMVTRPS